MKKTNRKQKKKKKWKMIESELLELFEEMAFIWTKIW